MTTGKQEQPDRPESVGLPMTPFLYHLDQVATILGFTVDELIDRYIFFVGRSRGAFHGRQIKAVNISVDPSAMPEWRVSEGELVRWLKLIGIKIYSRGRAV